MEYFNKIAPRYDEWYNTKVGRYVDKTEKRLVFSMIKTKSGKALDLFFFKPRPFRAGYGQLKTSL
ncbi:MAG: hypothetical protein PWQ32_1704 [Thermococcaceae archaeon]|nr:hypothetical protein [Thermococcaceae archaeon]